MTLFVALLLLPAGPVPKPSAPKSEVVSDKALDFHVVSDRAEPAAKFARRTKLIAASVAEDDLGDAPGMKALRAAKTTVPKLGLHYPTRNFDPAVEQRFMEFHKVAPLAPAVADLLKKAKGEDRPSLLFRVAEDGTLHVVGWTGQSSLQVFRADGKKEAASALRFGGDKKK